MQRSNDLINDVYGALEKIDADGVLREFVLLLHAIACARVNDIDNIVYERLQDIYALSCAS